MFTHSMSMIAQDGQHSTCVPTLGSLHAKKPIFWSHRSAILTALRKRKKEMYTFRYRESNPALVGR